MARSRLREDQVLDSDFVSEEENSFLYLNDVDATTYSGHGGSVSKFVKVKSDETGLEFSDISSGDLNVPRSIHWSVTPTYNGPIRVAGWYYSTDEDYNLSSGGTFSASEAGYNSFFSFNIKSGSGFPFTLTVTGTSVIDQEPDSNYFDTDEDITVTGTGYYRTSYSYINEPGVYIVEGSKSCTFDVYKFATWDACNNDITLLGIGSEFVPDQNNWEMCFSVYKINQDGSRTTICDHLFDDTDNHVRAAADKPGTMREPVDNLSILGSLEEGVVIYIDQSGISYFCILLSYI